MCKPLFDAMREVEDRILQAPHLLLCLDYDGTLTRFVDNPLAACLSPQMDRILMSLADHGHASLAIISGRDRADLQGRIGIPGVIYAGNFGLEISGPGQMFVEPTAAESATTLEEMAQQLTELLAPIPEVHVENKGLTISVHCRHVGAAALDEVRRLVRGAVARVARRFFLTAGEKDFEIRPRVRWNKASAFAWIKDNLAHADALAIYVGNDAADEDTFLAMPDGIAVKVGDSPATAASYSLCGPAEVRKFLEWVDDLLEHKALHHGEEQCVAAGHSQLVG